MIRKKRISFLLAILWILAAGNNSASEVITIGGGPGNNTEATQCGDTGYNFGYHAFAGAIANYPSIKNNPEYSLLVRNTCGSLDNLKRVNSGTLDIALVESTDLYFGRNGMITGDPSHYTNVLAVAYLFGSYAQLITRADTGIEDVYDLAGRRLNITETPETKVFFPHIGPINYTSVILPSSEIYMALQVGVIDAAWRFFHYPDPIIYRITQDIYLPFRLIGMDNEAEQTGFYSQYPCFAKASIPANTYPEVDGALDTFQYGHLLVARPGIPASRILNILTHIYSAGGLDWMKNNTQIAGLVANDNLAKEMHPSTGTRTIATPLHPGAKEFWNGAPAPHEERNISSILLLLLR